MAHLKGHVGSTQFTDNQTIFQIKKKILGQNFLQLMNYS